VDEYKAEENGVFISTKNLIYYFRLSVLLTFSVLFFPRLVSHRRKKRAACSRKLFEEGLRGACKSVHRGDNYTLAVGSRRGVAADGAAVAAAEAASAARLITGLQLPCSVIISHIFLSLADNECTSRAPDMTWHIALFTTFLPFSPSALSTCGAHSHKHGN